MSPVKIILTNSDTLKLTNNIHVVTISKAYQYNLVFTVSARTKYQRQAEEIKIPAITHTEHLNTCAARVCINKLRSNYDRAYLKTFQGPGPKQYYPFLQTDQG